MKKYYIYKIINTINNKIYIGKSNNPSMRFKEHRRLAESNKSNTHLHRAIRKHGIENFKLEVIEGPFTEDVINDKEKYYIKLFDTYNNGYNMTMGGDGGHTWDANSHPQTLERVKTMNIGRKCLEETKKKIGMANRGKNNGMWKVGKNHPNYGKKFSEELRKKLSESHIGKSNAGYKLTETQRENIRKSKLGKKYPNRKGKSVICIETNIVYPSLNNAARATNICVNQIRDCCNNRRKTAGGYHWKFTIEEDSN